MKRFYIAGAISCLSKEQYQFNFKLAEAELVELGYNPINPCTIHDDCVHGSEWLDFMRCDVSALLKCDGLYALRNWHLSKGATIEVELARALGLQVIYQSGSMFNMKPSESIKGL